MNADKPVKGSTLYYTRMGLVKVNLEDGNGTLNPSIGWQKQISTYKVLQFVNAVIHIPSAYTHGVVTSHTPLRFIMEANIEVGNPGITQS